MNFTRTPAGAIRFKLCMILFHSIGKRVLYFMRHGDDEEGAITCALAIRFSNTIYGTLLWSSGLGFVREIGTLEGRY